MKRRVEDVQKEELTILLERDKVTSLIEELEDTLQEAEEEEEEWNSETASWGEDQRDDMECELDECYETQMQFDMHMGPYGIAGKGMKWKQPAPKRRRCLAAPPTYPTTNVKLTCEKGSGPA